jgi:hypothetical protein
MVNTFVTLTWRTGCEEIIRRIKQYRNGVPKMKRLCQGIQAVTVELLGVLMVVGMLFGFTAMGLHSVSGQPPELGSAVTAQLSTWKDELSNRILRKSPRDEVRERYVANRLGYFSKTYSVAARHHVDRIINDVDVDY